MTAAARTTLQPATMADLDALPETMKGELIDGVLYAMTRPRARHQGVAGHIHGEYYSTHQRGRGGPGGWVILPEPGLELEGAPEVSPDLAGWKRERMPALPSEHSIRVVPDWVCEVLSPTTRRQNLRTRKPFYATVGVKWLWFADSEALVITVHRLLEGQWLEVGVFSDETAARIPPFEESAVDVNAWWPDRP